MIGDQTVTLIRRTLGTPDSYGNDTHTDSEIPLPGCQVQGRASSENVTARDQVVSGKFVYAPRTPAVLATDRVRVGAVIYDVDGDVGTWDEGVLAGQEFALTRTTG